MQEITLTINGLPVKGKPGNTILEIAQTHGFFIPTLCHDQHLDPYGACRVCVVEDEKRGALLPACVTPAVDGMLIRTDSPKVLETRTVVVKLMIANHPDSCIVCEKGNRCALRQVAADLGIGLVEYYPIPHFTGTHEVNPFMLRDLSKCILCAKCIRADHELVVEGAIDYIDRGFDAHPATITDGPLEKSECTFCGTCMELCPTGALFERDKRHRGSTTRRVATTCSFCGCGCSFLLETSDDTVIGVRPGIAGSVNNMTLCVKGHFGYELINHPDRLKKPLLKKDGLIEISWNDALTAAAQGLKSIKEKYGGASIALLCGPHCTNEEAFLLQRIASEGLQTNYLTSNVGMSMLNLVQGMEETLGHAGTTHSIQDLEETEAILVIGANPTESAPIVGYSIKRAVRKRHTALMVIDPLEIKLTKHARLWLQPYPCADELVLIAFLNFVVEHTRGSESLQQKTHKNIAEIRKIFSQLAWEDIEEKSGVPLEHIKEAADIFCAAGKRAIVFGNGLIQQPRGKDLVKIICTIGSLVGQLTNAETIIFPVIRQSNALGCLHMGFKLETSPETIIGEILNGHIKALWIMGDDPTVSLPGIKQIEKAFDLLELLIISDSFLTKAAKKAHIILPSATFAEKSGTVTNMEGRVQMIRPAINCVGESRPDWQIISQLAERLGLPFFYTSPWEITQEIIRKIPLYAGMVLPETATGNFSYFLPTLSDKEKAAFFVPDTISEITVTDTQYPYTLLVGSILFQLEAGSRTKYSLRLRKIIRDEYVELHPKDAAQKGIRDQDFIRLISPVGEKVIKAHCTSTVPQGVLFLPLPFAHGSHFLPFNDHGSGFKATRIQIAKENS